MFWGVFFVVITAIISTATAEPEFQYKSAHSWIGLICVIMCLALSVMSMRRVSVA
jgi:hypothetical protein